MTTFVLIHGSYQGGWIWQRVAMRLRSAGHTVYAPTMDGCGERRHQLRPGIDTSTYVAEVSDLLFYEDLHDVVLVGTSSGGMVVCGAAEAMRHRVERLVLVDALALFNGERTRDIVKRATTGPAVLASAPSREDAEKGLFADLDPATRAWVLDRYTPHPTGCSEGDGDLVPQSPEPGRGASTSRGGPSGGQMVRVGHRTLSDAQHACGADTATDGWMNTRNSRQWVGS